MSEVKLYSWNVNGIRAVLRKDEFVPFVEKHQPDILCLQETKAKEGRLRLICPPIRNIGTRPNDQVTQERQFFQSSQR